jgi:glyoxylase-like metal-dependent hydrolase (beta-lactamase superfamily II)
MRIVETPGHTLGHISVFEPATGILVAGDALRTSTGLAGSDPENTADSAKADASVRKLAAMDIRAILRPRCTPDHRRRQGPAGAGGRPARIDVLESPRRRRENLGSKS